MGCSVSLNSSSPPASSSSVTKNKNVRVVHLNGCVEEFDYPVSASQAAGPKHFVFTAAQLLSAGLNPLKRETLLERGHVYFILPSSLFDHADVSPMNLATTVKKLMEKAAKSGNSKSMPTSQVWNSPARSPNRAALGGIEGFPGKRSWTPILDTIREMSFSSRSASEIPDVSFQDH